MISLKTRRLVESKVVELVSCRRPNVEICYLLTKETLENQLIHTMNSPKINLSYFGIFVLFVKLLR